MMKANHNEEKKAVIEGKVGFNILKEHDESKSQLVLKLEIICSVGFNILKEHDESKSQPSGLSSKDCFVGFNILKEHDESKSQLKTSGDIYPSCWF